MATIADKFEYLLGTKAAIKNAITAKGVAVDDNATFRSYAESIGNIGSEVELKGVNFFDYDGTLLHTYTVEEAQALTELPPLPQQEGLICQEWNWSLADIKAHNRDVNVGATYITDDGKTRIYIKLSKDDELDFSLRLNQSAANAATVDWGDGSEPTSYEQANSAFYAWHTYPSVGEYCISIAVQGENTVTFDVTSTERLSRKSFVITSINLGSNVNISQSSFNGCINLSRLTVPSGYLSIPNNVLVDCLSLTCVVIPNGVTTIGTYAIQACFSLKNVILPNSVSYIEEGGLRDLYSLERITLPDSLTSLASNVLSECLSLTEVVLPSTMTWAGHGTLNGCNHVKRVTLPSIITEMGNVMLGECRMLTSIDIPSSVTSIGSNAFYNCTSLTSIDIPSSVTSIGSNAFQYCTSLTSIDIPSSVTSIGGSAFQYCTSLTSIDIPSSVTSIGGSAFYNLKVSEYHFRSVVPPTLSGTTVFYGIPSNCVIYVPMESVNAYKTATNWSKHASKIVGE